MKIPIEVPDGKSGDWKVSTFTVTEDELKIFNLRAAFHPSARSMEAGTYKQLKKGGTIVMSNTPAEIRDHVYFIHKATGHILINGLGLGVALAAILKKDDVKKVTIIENSEDVIKMVAPTYLKDSRVEIIHCSAFDYKPSKGVRYNAVWHDIWDNICGDNLPEMHKLHRKYGRRTDWQGSWCRELCER